MVDEAAAGEDEDFGVDAAAAAEEEEDMERDIPRFIRFVSNSRRLRNGISASEITRQHPRYWEDPKKKQRWRA